MSKSDALEGSVECKYECPRVPPGVDVRTLGHGDGDLDVEDGLFLFEGQSAVGW